MEKPTGATDYNLVQYGQYFDDFVNNYERVHRMITVTIHGTRKSNQFATAICPLLWSNLAVLVS